MAPTWEPIVVLVEWPAVDFVSNVTLIAIVETDNFVIVIEVVKISYNLETQLGLGRLDVVPI